MSINNAVREKILERDDHKCLKCSRGNNLQVHHIEPRRENGNDDEINLSTLCYGCHREWDSYEATIKMPDYNLWLSYPPLSRIIIALESAHLQNITVKEFKSELLKLRTIYCSDNLTANTINVERYELHNYTKAGLENARTRGIKGGAPKVLDEERTHRLYKLYDENNSGGNRKYTVKEICKIMGISRSSMYRYLNKRELLDECH